MFNIEYTSGLTVSITVTASPGSGESWVTGDPVISWGDGTTTGSVLNGRAYSHTYSSYNTYTISIVGENECGKTASYQEDITLVEECPTPTASFPNTPEISFSGTTATCRIYVNAGAGETPFTGTSIMGFDGTNWVDLTSQLDFTVQEQTVDLTWEMTASTDSCRAGGSIVNSCFGQVDVATDYYSYSECPDPTCSFTIN